MFLPFKNGLSSRNRISFCARPPLPEPAMRALLPLCVTWAFVATSLAHAEGKKLYPLMVGDPAPALSVDKWLKGEPVPAFAQGHVYVVEFWATWCGPCRRAMPHLSELQHRYRNDVTLIGVSVWEPRPNEVAPFVTKHAAQMDYTVATDDCPAAPTGTK